MAEIRLAFQWGVGEELVPVNVYQAIREVKPLRAGEFDIPEGKEVQPVPLELVRATLPFLSPEVAGIVELMMYTVSRPGEIAKITAEMIDKNGPEGAWVYWLGKHKMAWRGKKRFLVFGKEAQVVLKRHWKATGLFFVNERTGKKFTSEQIRKAIVWGCKRAGLAYWYPYQIRHATYSKTSLEHGVEAAALLAGHSNGQMAARYDHSKVARAAKLLPQDRIFP
jgi:integrase